MANEVNATPTGYHIQDLTQDMNNLWHYSSEWFNVNARPIVRCLFCMILSFFLYLLVVIVMKKIVIVLTKKKFRILANAFSKISKYISLLVLWSGFFFSLKLTHFTGPHIVFIMKVFAILFIIAIQMIVLHTIHFFMERIAEQIRESDIKAYAQKKLMLELAYSIIRLLVCCIAGVFILQRIFDFDVRQLLISAGVVGMGVAFAAQNTIANIFGAFSILGGKLFKVGDWIKSGNFEGNVEHIGFRAVRIRDFTGRTIDIPNRLIADTPLENYTTRSFWREHFVFGLVYQTTPEQINLALKIIDEIGVELADLMPEGRKPLFYFLKCNDFSLDIEGFVWFKCVEASTMREGRSIFNKAVFKRFNEAGLSFAYPTSTVFLEGDNAERKPTPAIPPSEQK